MVSIQIKQNKSGNHSQVHLSMSPESPPERYPITTIKEYLHTHHRESGSPFEKRLQMKTDL